MQSMGSVRRIADGSIESAEGWVVRLIGPEMLEYCAGSAACLVNVGYSEAEKARAIFATESSSDLFPHLREHLASASRLLSGHYVIV